MYEKIKISQTKLGKIPSDDLENYVHIETGEVLDITIDKKESQSTFINLQYKFTMINKDIDNEKLIRIIGASYYGYLLLLCTYIKTDNRVRLDKLPIQGAGLVKFKYQMKKFGIMYRLKLDNMAKGDYFINPLICSYNRECSLELINSFEKINKELYNVNLLTK